MTGTKYRARGALFVLLSLLASPARPAGSQILTMHQSDPDARARSLGDLSGSTRLDCVLSLPLRNQEALSNFIAQVYDYASTNYHRFLTPQEFTGLFGPTEADYQSLAAFTSSNGLMVTGTHSNRTLLDVNGSVADLEKVFHVKMRAYQHPTEARTFYAPDVKPSIDLSLPVLTVSGLENFIRPRPMSSATPVASIADAPRTGSGNGGAYTGNDFRTAYVPGIELTGTGQKVGLFELDGYYASDITNYLSQTGLRAVPLRNVLLNGFSGTPGVDNREPAVDIEVANSMAPGLDGIIVYEGVTPNDLLNRMATDNEAKQLSCSWGFNLDSATQQIFQQFAAQGQSFFLASGDSGAFSGAVVQPADDPYVTVVGGTVLSTSGPGGTWTSEAAWSFGGGGISTLYPIPTWQQGVDMSGNGGSTMMRNLPDVAMLAFNFGCVADNGASENLSGTSIAAPLWAGFIALVNQRAVAAGQPTVGFVNPAIYAIGKGTGFSDAFHDVMSGNNTTTDSPNLFFAVAGYDLCTGWGTPNGSNLIAALLAPPQDGLVVSPPLGFTATGASGGPFSVTSQTYLLTNAGTGPLNWTASDDVPFWLSISPSSGTLAPGADATKVTVSLSSAATAVLINAYTGSVWFTNLNTGLAQNRDFSLLVGNGGFESGDFSHWTLTGNRATGYNMPVAIDDSAFQFNVIPGVDDAVLVHSGIYGASLGENGSLSHLTQTLPTQAGQSYLLSFWLDNIPYQGTVTPNQFILRSNFSTLFNATNMPAFGWTNMHFRIEATSSQTAIQFGTRNDPGAFGLDDVTVERIGPPVFQTVSRSNGGITFTWNTVAGLAYQVQFTTDLTQNSWTTLASVLATGSTATASDQIDLSSNRFYRLVLSVR